MAICIKGHWFMLMTGHNCGIIAMVSYYSARLREIDSVARFNAANGTMAFLLQERYGVFFEFCSQMRSCFDCCHGRNFTSWQYVQIYM